VIKIVIAHYGGFSPLGAGGTIDKVLIKVFENLGFITRIINDPQGKIFNFEKRMFYAIPHKSFREFRNVDLLISNFLTCSSAAAYGINCLIIPHIELPTLIDNSLTSNDIIRQEPLFVESYFWRRLAFDILRRYGRHRAIFMCMVDVGMKDVIDVGIKTYMYKPNAKIMPKVDVKGRYDVVLNYIFWKAFGVKVLTKLSEVLKGLRVAVHDYYGSSKEIKKIAKKCGFDYYGTLRLEDYAKLYASTNMAYVVTAVEAFGVRFYEMAQLTHVATNIKFHDKIFPKVPYDELSEYIKGLDSDVVDEQKMLIAERVQELNKERMESRLREIVANVINDFGLEKGRLLTEWI